MFGRRKAMTHGDLMREEFSEGLGHLRQAAVHAAGGVGATVGPKWDSAKGHLPSGVGTTLTVFGPMLLAARTAAATATRKARKVGTRESGMSRKRTTMLVGLLAAGVAAGAAGAMMARRRNRAKWDEYEQRGIQEAREDARSVLDAAQSTVDETGASARKTANLFADQAAQTANTATARGSEAIEPGQ